MEFQFTPEQEKEFSAGVQRGIEQADRGEFIEHEEVKARIKRLLQPGRTLKADLRYH